MILTLAIVVGLFATLVRARLCNRKLQLPKFHSGWLVILSVLPQLLVFYFPALGQRISEDIIPFIQIGSMLGLAIFVALNFFLPGFWIVALGLLSNLLVIILNGGWMPILPETLHQMVPSKPIDAWELGSRLGSTKDRILASEDIKLIFLSDRFLLPEWIPYKVAFSFGDILISVGVVILLWSLSRRNEEKNDSISTN